MSLSDWKEQTIQALFADFCTLFIPTIMIEVTASLKYKAIA